MKRIIDFLARFLSAFFYPLLLPTYAVLLFFASNFSVASFLGVWYLVAVLCITFFLTFLLPLSFFYFLIRRGKVDDVYIVDNKQRTLPYLMCIVCYGIWCVFVFKIFPYSFSLSISGCIVAIILMSFINLRWKISAHLMAVGALLGGAINYCLSTGEVHNWLLLTLLAVGWLVMYSRLYLNAHTPLQVSCGFLVGLTFTWAAYQVGILFGIV